MKSLIEYVCIYRQNLALNDLQGLICHKTQTTNQPTTDCVYTRVFLVSSFWLQHYLPVTWKECSYLLVSELLLSLARRGIKLFWKTVDAISCCVFVYFESQYLNSILSPGSNPLSEGKETSYQFSFGNKFFLYNPESDYYNLKKKCLRTEL